MIDDLRECRLFSASGIPAGAIPENGVLTLPDGSQVTGKEVIFDASGMADIYEVADPQFCDPQIRHIFTAVLDSSSGGQAVLGCGNDWQMQLFLNGREILNTIACGNAEFPISPDNHKVLVELQPGKNFLRAELFGGLQGAVAFRLEKYVVPQVTYGPYLLFPDSYTGSISVVFATDKPFPAGLEYRKKGEDIWHRIYDNLGGKIRRNAKVHRIRLTGLECDCCYEYRPVLIDPAQNYTELPQNSGQFIIPAETCCFTATADLQLLDLRRETLINTLNTAPEAGFFAFLGDLRWVGDFDRNVLEEFAELFREVSGGNLPLVMVRGNHEYYGHDSDRYFEYFAAPAPGNDAYGIFRIGKVCFIMLDCGDDSPRRPAPTAWMLHDIEPYLEAEARWLQSAVEHPMCRTAEYRVVLCHGIPLGDPLEYLPTHVRNLIDPFFAGETPYCPIHLFIGGHVHHPFRSIPGENRCRAVLPEVLKGHPACGEKYRFPVITLAGPRGALPDNLQQSAVKVRLTGGGLEVISFDRNGKEYDRIEIAPDGGVTEKFCAEFFRYHNFE